MAFSLIGFDEAVGGSTMTNTTPAGTLIGDLIILRFCTDGGTFVVTPPTGFTEITGNLRHSGDTLGKWSWFFVADEDGATDYAINSNSASKSTLTVYRNTIGGGTWALDDVNSSVADTGGSFTLAGVTSVDDSLLLFSTSHDDNSGVTTPPTGMTAAADNPTGGDTIGLRSYFEDITSGAAESQTIVYTNTDAIIGDLSVFTYTISGGSETLIVDSGSYSTTGTTTPIKADFNTVSGIGSYSITGTTTPIIAAVNITSDAGSYAVTGTNIDLRFGSTLIVDAGSYATTGTLVNLNIAANMTIDGGSYIITGTDTPLLDAANIWTDLPITAATWIDGIEQSATWTDEAITTTTWTNL